jgi:hypothetical protein
LNVSRLPKSLGEYELLPWERGHPVRFEERPRWSRSRDMKTLWEAGSARHSKACGDNAQRH